MKNQFSKFVLMAVLGLALTFTFSCSGDGGDEGGGGGGGTAAGGAGGSCDISDYRTKKIGEQVWMAENLNCDVAGSNCYDNDPAKCAKYGRLYDWATAMGIDTKYNREEWGGSDVKHQGICPSGWHIPSDADWNALMKFINPSCSDNKDCPSAGTKLKTKNGWTDLEGKSSGNGTDDYGFSALPGGNGSSGGSFSGIGYYGSWLSSSEENNDYAYRRGIVYFQESVHYNSGLGKSYLMSVRCVKD